MLKVLTVVGTRPEIIRLSRIIEKLDRHCQHILVNTFQNFDFDLNDVFFKDLGIRRADANLNAAGATPAQTIASVITGVDHLLEQHRPDALLVLGDTDSALAAIPAKRRKVPIFHMEAGNRCFDFRVPEEINRRLVDHIADINLTYSEIAREYLIREGLPPDQVIWTGSPLREVIEHYWPAIEESNVLKRFSLEPLHYFVVSAHRAETVDDSEKLRRICELLNCLAERYGEPVIVSTHPRTRKRWDELQLGTHALVQLCPPFGYLDYVKLQCNAHAVLSDSGTITEESSILNFPALNLREVHERPEGFREAAVMLVGLDKERVVDALNVLETQPRGSTRLLRMVDDYQPSNVSDKVLRIMYSYTDFVNRKVWRKGQV
jgi:UDP-N-acetylglucosamine 2-epimerase